MRRKSRWKLRHTCDLGSVPHNRICPGHSTIKPDSAIVRHTQIQIRISQIRVGREVDGVLREGYTFQGTVYPSTRQDCVKMGKFFKKKTVRKASGNRQRSVRAPVESFGRSSPPRGAQYVATGQTTMKEYIMFDRHLFFSTSVPRSTSHPLRCKQLVKLLKNS